MLLYHVEKSWPFGVPCSLVLCQRKNSVFLSQQINLMSHTIPAKEQCFMSHTIPAQAPATSEAVWPAPASWARRATAVVPHDSQTRWPLQITSTGRCPQARCHNEPSTSRHGCIGPQQGGRRNNRVPPAWAFFFFAIGFDLFFIKSKEVFFWNVTQVASDAGQRPAPQIGWLS
jgi:hypothetical protein